MHDLPPNLRGLLDQAQRAAVPSAEQSSRVLAQIERSVAQGVPPQVGARLGRVDMAGLGAGKGGWLAAAKVCGVVTAVVAVGVAAALVASGGPEEKPIEPVTAIAPVEAPEPAVPAFLPELLPARMRSAQTPVELKLPPAQPQAVEPEPRPEEDAPPKTVKPKRPSKPPPPPAAGRDLASESLLVARASAALSSGDYDKALALARRHARDFRRGQLVDERLAIEVLALCKSGRMDAGKAARRRFLAQQPRSPHAPRVRRACGG